MPLAVVLVASCGAPSTPRSHSGALPVQASSGPAVGPAPLPADDDADDGATRRRVVAETLRRHEPWSDPLPRGALARLGTTQFQHGFAVGVAGPKGSILSGSHYYGVLQRWDAKTGDVVATGKIDGAETLNVAAASRDGKTALFADSYAIYLVDSETLKVRMTKKFFDRDGDGSRIEDVALHPDGRIAVGACSKNPSEALRILDAHGDQIMQVSVARPKESYDEACASRVEFSPDGSLLAGAVNGKARIYSFPEGRELASFESGVSVQAIAFSHDGKRLYVGGYGDAVNAFDTKTFKAVRSFGFFDYDHDRQVNVISVSPDDRTVAIDARVVRLFDTSSGAELGRLPGVAGGKTMTFPSADVVAYPVADPAAIGRFDLAKHEVLAPADLGRHDGELRNGAFSTDGSSVFTAADGAIRRWSTKNGAPLATWATDEAWGGLEEVVVVPQTGVVLSVGATSTSVPSACELLFHDSATLEVNARIAMPHALDRRCAARGIAVSRDGARAYVLTDALIASFDLRSKAPIATAKIAEADQPRTRVFVTSDGTLAYGNGESVIFLDADKLSKKREVKSDATAASLFDDWAISPDGQRAVSIVSRDVVIGDLSTGKVLAKTALTRGGEAFAAAFSSDGKRVYVGYREGETSGMASFDATTGKPIADLPRLHTSENPVPRFIAESADGSRIVEGNSDTTALVVDAKMLRGGPQ